MTFVIKYSNSPSEQLAGLASWNVLQGLSGSPTESPETGNLSKVPGEEASAGEHKVNFRHMTQ